MPLKKPQHTFRAKIWLYQGMAGWHFVTVPKKLSATIKKNTAHVQRGWGSVRVQVTIRTTVWNTSIFPDRMSGTYLLPLKAQVRKKEGLLYDEMVTVTIVIGNL